MLGTRRALQTKRKSTWPGGALGLWNIDQYQALPRPHIPNSVAPDAPSKNLFSASRRLFSKTDWWVTGSATATDAAVDAGDGTGSQNDGSTIVSSGTNWSLKTALTHTLPAGTYTIACNVKSNGAGLDTFCFYDTSTINRGSTLTATGSWARYSRTFTVGSVGLNTIGMASKDGSTHSSLQIRDFELYAGSVDLGPQTYSGHMIMGGSAFDTRPVYTRGELDLHSQGYSLASFLNAHSFSTSTGLTVQGLVSQSNSHIPGGYSAILSKAQSFGQFSAMTSAENTIGCKLTGATFGPSQSPGLWKTLNAGYHVFTMRYTGTRMDLWVDDCKMMSAATSMSAISAVDYYTNITNTVSIYGGNKFAGTIGLWNRSLSDDEILKSVAMQQDRAQAAGVTVTNAPRILCCEGDSITGTNICYPYLYAATMSPHCFAVNQAISGSAITNLNTRAANVDAMLPPRANRAGRKFILTVFIGSNDVVGYSGGNSAWLAALFAYTDARRAAGWTVGLTTLLPCTAAGFNTARNIINPSILAAVGTHGDFPIDFAAEATMGPDSVCPDGGSYNAVYYSDGRHPTATGQALLAVVFNSAVNAV